MSARHARPARRPGRDLGRLVPADQVRARWLLGRDDRVGALPARRRVVLFVALRRGGGAAPALRRHPRAAAWALLLGLAAVAAPFLLITFGEHVVPSGLTAVLISPASLFVALLAPSIDPSRVDRPPRRASGCCSASAAWGWWSASSRSHRSRSSSARWPWSPRRSSTALTSFIVKGRYGHLAAMQTSWISVTVRRACRRCRWPSPPRRATRRRRGSAAALSPWPWSAPRSGSSSTTS